MSPQNARVFIVEDDDRFIQAYRKVLEESGHTISAIATNRQTMEEIIPQLGHLGVQVAVLDIRLVSWDDKSIEGKIARKTIKNLFPYIKTVGMSSGKFPETDYDLGKHRIKELGEVVIAL